MRVQQLLGGLFVTSAVVSAGSVALGISSKNMQKAKLQKEKILHYEQNLSKSYKSLDPLILRANYEKVYLQTKGSLKKI